MPTPETYVNVGGTNRKIGANGSYVKQGGVWNTVNFSYVNVAGVWQTVYVRDVSGPAAPTNIRATWEGAGLRISWTNPADTDYAYMAVNVQPGTAPYIFGDPILTPTNSFLWTTHVLNNLVYTVQLIPVDTNGNPGAPTYVQSMEWTGAARGRSPSPILFWPADSGTWYVAGSNWRTDVQDRVLQGAFPGGEFIGMYFYGSQFYDLIRGATISSAALTLFRVNSGGTVLPVTPTIWGSTCVAKPQNPVGTLYKGIISGPPLSLNGSTPVYTLGWPIPSTLFVNMNSTIGQSRFNAMGFWANDTVMRPDLGGGNVSASYMQMYSAFESPFNIKSGAIVVDHSG